jgi:hypothetical protein
MSPVPSAHIFLYLSSSAVTGKERKGPEKLSFQVHFLVHRTDYR